MARIAPFFLAALALVAVFATAPDYSIFAKYYVQYGTSQFRSTCK